MPDERARYGWESDFPDFRSTPAGEIVWKFNRAGTFEFACLIPGHFQAGMVGRVIVAEAK